MTTNLTLTHLRFDLVAREPIHLGRHRAGQRLRDALASVMLRTVCPETRRTEKPAPEHAAVCPVCWLLAAELDPGQVRRAYAIVPPREPLEVLEPGQRFAFGITLFGQGLQFLPYFVLTVQEMGRVGIGPGRGKFELEAIWAGNPLDPPAGGQGGAREVEGAGLVQPVLRPGETMVYAPSAEIRWEQVERAAQRLRAAMGERSQLRLRFLSPTRLVYDETLVKTADFGVFFRRLLERIDQLRRLFAGEERRPQAEIDHLHALADQVRLVEDNTRWMEVSSWSGRQRRKQWLSGIVGTATYRSHDWDELLPWLILGQATQVGKLAVKGNGVYEILVPGGEPYWGWLVVSG